MFGIVRKLVKLAILLLIANAVYQFVPPYVHYEQFRDGVHEALVFSVNVPDSVLADKIVALAEEYRVPVDRDGIEIRRDAAHIYIDASYVQVIHFAPFYSYPWAFEVKTDAIRVSAVR